jgi:Fe-S-cluster containining protein
MIELSPHDMEREPRLAPLARSCTVRLVPTNQAGSEVGEAVATRKSLAMVSDGPNEACRFLASDNRCGVYETRPESCRIMEAGSDHCQRERRRVGLPPLQPVAAGDGKAVTL